MLVSILENINCHEDLLALNDAQRIALCGEIRQFLIEHVSKTGGHLASNLGVVEKEVIHPHLPVVIPCYDFTPVTCPTFDGPLLKG